MQTFKKTLLAIISFVLIVACLSLAIILPWANSESVYYLDSKYRNELAGSLDCIVSGASHGLTGFLPSVLDEKTSCNSYNISGTLMTMEARTVMLENELKRNPVNTVIIEVSYNALTRQQNSEHAEGDFVTISRLDNIFDMLSFMTENLTFNEWLDVYSRALFTGVFHLRALVAGKVEKVDFSTKGYYERTLNNMVLNDEQAANLYNTITIEEKTVQTNVKQLEKQIKISKEKGCRVIVVVTPVTDSLIWQTKNFDVFNLWLDKFCEQQNCEFYDFNLLKERYELFSDETSYHDNVHLNKTGAISFTTAFSTVINKAKCGENTEALFYKSYNDLKEYSPYNKNKK